MDLELSFSEQVDITEEWVQLAKTGEFIHPSTRKKVVITKEDFLSWMQYKDYLTAQGNTIPLVSGHSLDPLDRLGTVEELRISTDGTKMFGKIKWATEEYAKKTIKASFSVWMKNDHVTSENKKFKSALMHLGVTDYPVLSGLKRSLDREALLVETGAFSEFLSAFPSYTQGRETGENNPKGDNKVDLETALKTIEDLKASGAAKDAQIETLTKAVTTMQLSQRKEKIEALGFSDDEKKKFAAFIDPLLTEASLSIDKDGTMFSQALEGLKAIKATIKPARNDEQFSTGHQDQTGEGSYDGDSLLSFIEERNKKG